MKVFTTSKKCVNNLLSHTYTYIYLCNVYIPMLFGSNYTRVGKYGGSMEDMDYKMYGINKYGQYSKYLSQSLPYFLAHLA